MTQRASLPQLTRNRNSERVAVRAGGTFETQAVWFLLFLLKQESLFYDANFEKLVPICSEQKNFGLKKTKFELGSLAFWLSLLHFWASASNTTTPIGFLPKVDKLWEKLHRLFTSYRSQGDCRISYNAEEVEPADTKGLPSTPQRSYGSVKGEGLGFNGWYQRPDLLLFLDGIFHWLHCHIVLMTLF